MNSDFGGDSILSVNLLRYPTALKFLSLIRPRKWANRDKSKKNFSLHNTTLMKNIWWKIWQNLLFHLIIIELQWYYINPDNFWTLKVCTSFDDEYNVAWSISFIHAKETYAKTLRLRAPFKSSLTVKTARKTVNFHVVNIFCQIFFFIKRSASFQQVCLRMTL